MTMLESIVSNTDPINAGILVMMWYHVTYRLNRLETDHDRLRGKVQEVTE